MIRQIRSCHAESPQPASAATTFNGISSTSSSPFTACHRSLENRTLIIETSVPPDADSERECSRASPSDSLHWRLDKRCFIDATALAQSPPGHRSPNLRLAKKMEQASWHSRQPSRLGEPSSSRVFRDVPAHDGRVGDDNRFSILCGQSGRKNADFGDHATDARRVDSITHVERS